MKLKKRYKWFTPALHYFQKIVNNIRYDDSWSNKRWIKTQKINLAMLIIPWLTVPFIGKQKFFRFLPAACFISIFLAVFSSTANSKGWWKTKRPLIPGILVDFPYILGPYFVGTIWIFKLTYGNFKKYVLANLLVGIINTVPFIFYTEKVVELFNFKKMNKFGWYFKLEL